MYSLIGLKDPSTRQVFEVKLQSEKPATPGDVLKSLKEILRSRVRAEQIDEASSDTPALASTQCDAYLTARWSGHGRVTRKSDSKSDARSRHPPASDRGAHVHGIQLARNAAKQPPAV